MAMTPERRVKAMVDTCLEQLAQDLETIGMELHRCMHVPFGYGKKNALDYTLCIFGQFVAIETKPPGEWLTPLQRVTARNIIRSGGKVFIISGPEGLAAFTRWCNFKAEFGE